MAKYADLLTRLGDYVDELDKSLLTEFDKPEYAASGPDIWGHPTKAYCVLSHAAFEDFVETLSLRVLQEAIDLWLNDKKTTRPLLAALAFYRADFPIEEDEKKPQLLVFDLLRKALDQIKTAHSKALNDNHGFNVKYLRKILTPIAVDVDLGLKYEGSVDKLCQARGRYAHKITKDTSFSFHSVASSISPKDARNLVGDCIEYCELLDTRAERSLK